MVKLQALRAMAPARPRGQSRDSAIAGSLFQRLADSSAAVARLQALSAQVAPVQRSALQDALQRRAAPMWQPAALKLQLMPKPQANNEKLANHINNLFRGAPARGRKIGDGSAMAACTHELKTGKPVGGRFHRQKIEDTRRGLQKLRQNHYDRGTKFHLTKADLKTVKTLMRACTEALAGKYNG